MTQRCQAIVNSWWELLFAVYASLHVYPPYISLSQSCDISRGGLSIRVYTPVTMQQELLRYQGLDLGALGHGNMQIDIFEQF